MTRWFILTSLHGDANRWSGDGRKQARAREDPVLGNPFFSLALFPDPTQYLVYDRSCGSGLHTKCGWRYGWTQNARSAFREWLESGIRKCLPRPGTTLRALVLCLTGDRWFKIHFRFSPKESSICLESLPFNYSSQNGWAIFQGSKMKQLQGVHVKC